MFKALLHTDGTWRIRSTKWHNRYPDIQMPDNWNGVFDKKAKVYVCYMRKKKEAEIAHAIEEERRADHSAWSATNSAETVSHKDPEDPEFDQFDDLKASRIDPDEDKDYRPRAPYADCREADLAWEDMMNKMWELSEEQNRLWRDEMISDRTNDEWPDWV